MKNLVILIFLISLQASAASKPKASTALVFCGKQLDGLSNTTQDSSNLATKNLQPFRSAQKNANSDFLLGPTGRWSVMDETIDNTIYVGLWFPFEKRYEVLIEREKQKLISKSAQPTKRGEIIQDSDGRPTYIDSNNLVAISPSGENVLIIRDKNEVEVMERLNVKTGVAEIVYHIPKEDINAKHWGQAATRSSNGRYYMRADWTPEGKLIVAIIDLASADMKPELHEVIPHFKLGHKGHHMHGASISDDANTIALSFPTPRGVGHRTFVWRRSGKVADVKGQVIAMSEDGRYIATTFVKDNRSINLFELTPDGKVKEKKLTNLDEILKALKVKLTRDETGPTIALIGVKFSNGAEPTIAIVYSTESLSPDHKTLDLGHGVKLRGSDSYDNQFAVFKYKITEDGPQKMMQHFAPFQGEPGKNAMDFVLRPNGDLLFSAISSEGLVIWSPDRNPTPRTYKRDKLPAGIHWSEDISHLKFSADGNLLAISTREMVHLLAIGDF